MIVPNVKSQQQRNMYFLKSSLEINYLATRQLHSQCLLAPTFRQGGNELGKGCRIYITFKEFGVKL